MIFAVAGGAIWSPQIKPFYQRRQAKQRSLVAQKPTANWLTRASYHMLKRQGPFVERCSGARDPGE